MRKTARLLSPPAWNPFSAENQSEGGDEMTTNGMTVIEKQFMETVMKGIRRIADALEDANKLRREEIDARKKDREQMAILVEAFKQFK